MSDISEKAIHIAARVWCDQDMGHIVMDQDAAMEIAKIVDRLLREQRPCECCGKPSNDTTKGSAYCGPCDGGHCNGEHDD